MLLFLTQLEECDINHSQDRKQKKRSFTLFPSLKVIGQNRTTLFRILKKTWFYCGGVREIVNSKLARERKESRESSRCHTLPAGSPLCPLQATLAFPAHRTDNNWLPGNAPLFCLCRSAAQRLSFCSAASLRFATAFRVSEWARQDGPRCSQMRNISTCVPPPSPGPARFTFHKLCAIATLPPEEDLAGAGPGNLQSTVWTWIVSTAAGGWRLLGKPRSYCCTRQE